MMVGPISPIPPQPPKVGSAGGTTAPGFGEILSRTLDEVNSTQVSADQAQTAALNGTGSLEQAMITTEKANLDLDLTTQVRNRALQAYQQIMTMPV